MICLIHATVALYRVHDYTIPKSMSPDTDPGGLGTDTPMIGGIMSIYNHYLTRQYIYIEYVIVTNL